MQPQYNFISAVKAIYFLPWCNSSSGPGYPYYRGFMIILSKTPLDEWSARRRNLYLITPNTYKNPQSQQVRGCKLRL